MFLLPAALGIQNTTQVASMVDRLFQLYPNIPALGSPYAPVNISVDDPIFGPGNQFKRIASFFGDVLLVSGW